MIIDTQVYSYELRAKAHGVLVQISIWSGPNGLGVASSGFCNNWADAQKRFIHDQRLWWRWDSLSKD